MSRDRVVTEARRGRERFGGQGLQAVLAAPAGSAGELVAAVTGAVATFSAGEAADDMAVLALRVPEYRGSGDVRV